MKKGKIKIDKDRCKGCLICVEECKRNAIKEGDKVNRYGYIVVEFVDEDRCNACKLCAIACPDAAIEVIELIEEIKK